MNRLVDRQFHWNVESLDRWQTFAEHRRHVTEVIAADAAMGNQRLCVLGAGNCNDLDLHSLAESFDEIHLVDLDHAALKRGSDAQQVSGSSAIRLHGDHDLTGIWQLVAQWTPQTPAEPADVKRVCEAALSSRAPAIGGPFDVVASVCLLSQLTEAIVCTLGEHHPLFLPLLRAVRLRHLQLIAEWTRPGGTSVIVTDVGSSDTAPELASVRDADLPGLLSLLIEQRNFFHGMNPAVLADLLKNDPGVAPLFESIEYLQPWIWDFGVRKYAVVALRLRRARPSC